MAMFGAVLPPSNGGLHCGADGTVEENVSCVACSRLPTAGSIAACSFTPHWTRLCRCSRLPTAGSIAASSAAPPTGMSPRRAPAFQRRAPLRPARGNCPGQGDARAPAFLRRAPLGPSITSRLKPSAAGAPAFQRRAPLRQLDRDHPRPRPHRAPAFQRRAPLRPHVPHLAQPEPGECSRLPTAGSIAARSTCTVRSTNPTCSRLPTAGSIAAPAPALPRRLPPRCSRLPTAGSIAAPLRRRPAGCNPGAPAFRRRAPLRPDDAARGRHRLEPCSRLPTAGSIAACSGAPWIRWPLCVMSFKAEPVCRCDCVMVEVCYASAAVAVILGEPGGEELAGHLEDAVARLMPAAIRVELGIVIEARLWPAG